MKYLRLACITCSLILLGIVLYSDIESDVIKYSIVLFFIAFLQLQIIACYILLLMTTPLLYILYNLISLCIQYLILLFSKRTTNKFMKWLTLVITDNVIYRLWNIFVLYCLSQIIYYGIKYYIMIVFWIGTFLLGYTEI